MIRATVDNREPLHGSDTEKKPQTNTRGWLFGRKLAERVKRLKPGEFIMIDYPRSNKRNIKYYLRKRHGVDVKAHYSDGNKVLLSFLQGPEKEG